MRNYSSAIIEAIINSVPVALLLVNHSRIVQDIFISNRRVRNFRETELELLLNRLLTSEITAQILSKFDYAIAANQATTVRRFNVQTSHGYEEFYNCKITPLLDINLIAVMFINESESALLEQELCTITEQAESSQRDLCAAISELDFRLMDFDQTNKRLQVLYKVASLIQSNTEEDQVLYDIIDIVRREFNCTGAAVLLLNNTEDTLVMFAQKGYPSFHNIPVSKGVTGYCARTRELVFVPDVAKDERYIQMTEGCVCELALPLIVSDRVIGVLDLEYSTECSLSPFDFDLLRTIAIQAALTIAHVQQVAQIKKMAITDELTGLYNFHHFCAILDHEYHRALRYSHPLSVLMIDIDDFKKINDSLGHLAGNEVLAKVAALISRQTRVVDKVCRYGGEEFVVLLPDTAIDESLVVAERIRATIATCSLIDSSNHQCSTITVSIGVSSLCAGETEKKDIIARADIALLEAKRAAKNCVRAYRREGGER